MVSPSRRLSLLLHQAGFPPLPPGEADPVVTGAALHSASVEPGFLFFALPGARQCGESFVPDALARGALAVVAGSPRPSGLPASVAWVQAEAPRTAAALLSRECYGRPDLTLTLVGVTGTNGKTTTTYLIEAIAHAAGRRAGRIGTTGYSYGAAAQPLARTTPEAPDFYRLLARMREQGVEIVAMEVSSHALALERVAGARFALAAFLNLGRDHLDFHASQADYFAAKAKLFTALQEGQKAVLPADCAHGRKLAELAPRAEVTFFGRSPRAHVQLLEEHCTLAGSSAILRMPSGKLPIRTFLPGPFNLENIAAAAACALALGLPPEAIAAGVLALEHVPGRMERIDLGQPFTVVVDYAHTEDALRRLLSWARLLTRGRLWVIFGCGGERDTGKRAAMGRAAAELADRIVLTSDNPRGEEPQQIIEQIAGGMAAVPDAMARLRIEADRREAIRVAIGEAAPEDVLLVAGKGHETTQTIGERSEAFDDRQVAAAALRERGFDGAGRARA
jgi:UDP-N-acetylmuramoyl-L-alanyl-D-glutamate--2,6-diaminopimelate ligase